VAVRQRSLGPGVPGKAARQRAAGEELENDSVTDGDAQSDRSPSVGNPQSPRRRMSAEERNKTMREILGWRGGHLERALEALAIAARQYTDELSRDDKLHTARLRRRRDELLGPHQDHEGIHGRLADH